ncbi:carboxy-S-adenosyl-L-methionine synthase CmoA [Hydrogenimonas sp.]
MERDEIFSEPLKRQFVFDEKVAAVFDDMIERSVPYYRQNIDLIVSLLLRRIEPGMKIVDLGCSTGAFLIELARRIECDVSLVGIDNAPAMIERAKRKAEAMESDIEFVCADIMEYEFCCADIVVASYTLQFIRPPVRAGMVKRIFSAMNEEALFVCSEKVLMQSPALNRDIIEIYYDYKKMQGYSDTEIARKREALENVLIPYTIEENLSMFKDAGFCYADTIFQWGNFATMVAEKVP